MQEHVQYANKCVYIYIYVYTHHTEHNIHGPWCMINLINKNYTNR